MAGRRRRARALEAVSAMWMVRSKKGHLFQTFLEECLVALGGKVSEPSIGDIGRYDTYEALRAWVQTRRKDMSTHKAAHPAGALFRLSRQIRVGDRVITDKPLRPDVHYAIGTVIGEYRYEKGRVLEPERYPHVRDVRWDGIIAAKSDLPAKIQHELGKRLSVFELSRNAAERLRGFCAAGRCCNVQLRRRKAERAGGRRCARPRERGSG